MQWIMDPESWIALLTLTTLEMVLGIDNIIFISVLAARLPAGQRQRARLLGLAIGMGLRIVLLFSLTFVMRWTTPRDLSSAIPPLPCWRSVSCCLSAFP
jgi:predicted tellurium resistance membrane protein TerC